MTTDLLIGMALGVAAAGWASAWAETRRLRASVRDLTRQLGEAAGTYTRQLVELTAVLQTGSAQRDVSVESAYPADIVERTEQRVYQETLAEGTARIVAGYREQGLSITEEEAREQARRIVEGLPPIP